LVDALCSPHGIFTGFDLVTKQRLMALVQAYWMPLCLQERAQPWRVAIETRLKGYPRAHALWISALEAANESSNAPGASYGRIQLHYEGVDYDVEPIPIPADPRIEMVKLSPINLAPGRRARKLRPRTNVRVVERPLLSPKIGPEIAQPDQSGPIITGLG
jgi:hypothetical protein